MGDGASSSDDTTMDIMEENFGVAISPAFERYLEILDNYDNPSSVTSEEHPSPVTTDALALAVELNMGDCFDRDAVPDLGASLDLPRASSEDDIEIAWESLTLTPRSIPQDDPSEAEIVSNYVDAQYENLNSSDSENSSSSSSVYPQTSSSSSYGSSSSSLSSQDWLEREDGEFLCGVCRHKTSAED